MFLNANDNTNDTRIIGGIVLPQKGRVGERYLLAKFEKYWPEHSESWPGINDVKKYVLSTTRNKSDWESTVFIESLEDIKKLKNTEGSDIQVWGSGKLVQLLLENDLVDELCLKIYPLTLGEGKKLFDNGTMPAAFTLTESSFTPSGVIIANYKRAGKVKTGTVGA